MRNDTVTGTARTRILACLAAFAVAAAACGGGDSAAPDPAAAPTAAAAPAAAPTADQGPAVIPTTGVELPGDPATPEPDSGATTGETVDGAAPTAAPTAEAAPVPAPDTEADAPDPVACDTAGGELSYDSDGDEKADGCKNPDTGEEAVPAPTPIATAAPTPTPTPTDAATAGSGSSQCHPAYEPCLPNLPGDVLNCGDLTSDQKPVRVLVSGVDPYRLDRDGDGRGCTT